MFASSRFAVFALLLACSGGTSENKPVTPPAPPKPVAVKIGVITVLSGENAEYGTYTRNGIELAMKEHPTTSVEVVYEDSKADAQEALRVFKELQAVGAPAVIGPFTSTEVRQVGPAAQAAGVVLVTSSATADDLSSVGDHLFMMLPPNSKQGSDQATYAATKLGAKRAAILWRENPYGTTLHDSFKNTFEASGGQIVADKSFPDGIEEFRDYLKAIAKEKPDVVFIPTHDGDTGRILAQARAVKFPPTHFLGGDGSMTSTMLGLAKDAAEGSVYTNVASVDPAFDQAYRTAYGKDPSPYAASAYDTIKVLVSLVEKGARTSDDLEKGLVSLTGHQGATGPTKFTLVDKSYWCMDKAYRQFEVVGGAFKQQ